MSVQVWPYRRPIDRVRAEAWRSGDASGSPMPAALTSWDYATDVEMARVVDIDLLGFRKDCGLTSDAPLRLCVRYWPSTSLIRRTAFSEMLPGHVDRAALEVQIVTDSSVLGGHLTVETLIELAVDRPPGEPFVATRAGSILWMDQTRVHLEGGAGLLPIAPVSFVKAGLPEGATWYVNLDGTDWHQAAMGSLLVLLNEDHPAIKQALESTKDDASGMLWSLLEVDIVTDLIGRAVDDEAFFEETPPEDLDADLTMAGLVRALIRTYMVRPAESVDQAAKRLRDERRRDPSRFRTQVQAGLRFLKEVPR
ncbi:hypothetical protein ACFYVL_12755 [Streptomyces sp. NPDC004111]|uniref:hypothetical protein n=1 Tax=Streptomyces sp. NPDC004111 TaxID=3364690 RepID=UPI00368F040B